VWLWGYSVGDDFGKWIKVIIGDFIGAEGDYSSDGVGGDTWFGPEVVEVAVEE